MVWQGKHMDPQRIIEQSMQFLSEYRRVMLSKVHGVNVAQRQSARWKPLDVGFVKINTDGAISVKQRNFGMGAILRDCSGEVMAAMACKDQGAVEATVAEACSLRRALQWAHDLSLTRIIMESDYACIVTALNIDSFTANSNWGSVLLDCKMLMKSFLACRVRLVRRTGNSVAHELAKRALQAEADEYWVGAIPADMAHAIFQKPSGDSIWQRSEASLTIAGNPHTHSATLQQPGGDWAAADSSLPLDSTRSDPFFSQLSIFVYRTPNSRTPLPPHNPSSSILRLFCSCTHLCQSATPAPLGLSFAILAARQRGSRTSCHRRKEEECRRLRRKNREEKRGNFKPHQLPAREI
ncbi:hypothetical protein SLEP1_g26129 [Rubroshorea leprosula]|uniref:RNase H type-1 domain-containing protein n=1 Tax=Rubroshorea leprosula TaxID=152421 RepID=A0AAV5JUS1_9ROSI|nr:hypothetical protein SLEP1_g26129 [Rubroshorea leprosula]